MIINTNISYAGRSSRLCYLMPLMVHTIFIYLSYFIYFNVEIISIYILLIIIIFINLEWPTVIMYEYILLRNTSIQNNLLYNICMLIILEIILFAGFYWLYVSNIIHYPGSSPSNSTISLGLIDHLNSNNNTDLTLSIILHNLLLLLYVTLILQLVHRYLLNPSPSSSSSH